MKNKDNKFLMRIIAAILFGVMCLTTVYASIRPAFADGIVEQTAGDTSYSLSDPNKAAIVFHVKTLPEDFDAGVKCQVNYSPSRSYGKAVTLSKLNEWTQAVEIPAGENLYWNANVTNDLTQDYPVSLSVGSIYKYNEQKGRGEQIGLNPGEVVVVNINVSDVSSFEQMTGDNRYYEKEDVIAAPEGVDVTRQAQIGVYVSASEGFSDNVNIYLQNLYTGKVYTLKVYSANNMMAMEQSATEGLYKYIGCDIASVNGGERYTVSMEKDTLPAPGDAASFHLTIIDNENPDAAIKTPVLEENEVWQEMVKDETVSEPVIEKTPAPSEPPVQEEQPDPLVGYIFLAIVATAILGAAGVVYMKIKENKA